MSLYICQLSYPDHSGYHVNLHFNSQMFATCLVHYMKLIGVLDTLCQKNMLICVISDINQAVHPKNSHQIYILIRFLVNLGTQIHAVLLHVSDSGLCSALL